MHILITGGGGFIGSHVAETYAGNGHQVTVLDNLSRAKLLGKPEGDSHFIWDHLGVLPSVTRVVGSVLDRPLVEELMRRAEVVVHAAAQTAVTTSVIDPVSDFETNAVGTFRILEAARGTGRRIPVVLTSTNKVYGDNVNRIPIREGSTRYEFGPEFESGVPESVSVDGCEHTPYGASKLSADLYAQEYAHLYGLPTAVFRMSCIYGPRQFGVEDQGWVAHFAISALTERPITIFGDGKQVRDVLYVGDLVSAIEKFIDRVEEFPAGLVCNIGGGPRHTLSLLELLEYLEQKTGRRPNVRFADWRPSDQRVYVSDVRRAKMRLGWEPLVSAQDGLRTTVDWVRRNLDLFQ